MRLQAMNRRDRIRQDNLDSVRSMEYVVNDQLDNFVAETSREFLDAFVGNTYRLSSNTMSESVKK